MEGKTTIIETKLTSTNYSLWSFSIKIVLEDEGQHDATAVIEEGDSPFAVRDTPRAKRIIFLNCSQEVQATLTNFESARLMWNHLYRQNSGQNVSRKNHGIKRLATFCYNKPTVQENILELTNLVTATVVAAGTETISIQELGVHMFLNALPFRFNSARALLEAKETELTIDTLSKSLVAEEERILARTEFQKQYAGSAAFKKCKHGRPANRCWTCDPMKHPSKATCKDCKTVGHFSKNSAKCSLFENNDETPKGVAGVVKRSSDDDSFGDITLSPKFSKYNKTDDYEPNDLRLKLKGKVLMATDANPQDDNVFILDSGCTQSILKNKRHLKNYRPYEATFTSADYGTINVTGVGDLTINADLTITNCLYASNIAMNLISENHLCKHGLTINTNENSKIIKRKRKTILTAKASNGLYIFYLNMQRAMTLSHSRTLMFHRRMGHLNLKSLRLLSHLCDGMVLDQDPKELCTVCAQTKAHKSTFSPSTSLAKRIGDLTHADICHIGVEDILGKRKLFLLLVDDAARWMTIYPIQHKNDAVDIIISYDKKMYLKTGRHLSTLRSDGGGEFFNQRLEEYFKSNGTVQQSSTPYNPQQNGRAERPNRTVLEGIRAMLLDANLPWEYWAFAAECFVYLKNRSPHNALYKSTPYQEWFGKIPDITNVRVFGYPCYVFIPPEVRKRKGPGHKLLPNATKMLLVGYSDKHKAWKCFQPKTKEVVYSANVQFDTEMLQWNVDQLEPKQKKK